MKKITTLLLIAVLTFSLFGCKTKNPEIISEVPAQDSDYEAEPLFNENCLTVEMSEPGESFTKASYDFYTELFKNTVSAQKNKNLFISPLSVQYALAMVLNGADGETKAQIEKVICPNISAKDLTLSLAGLTHSFSKKESCALTVSNSVWFRDSELLEVKAPFIANCKGSFNADIFKEPFDSTTLAAINNWVSKTTNGMIDKILNEISSENMLFLINTLCFDAKWRDPYYDVSVRDGVFTDINGKEQMASMMYGSEYDFIEDENAKGFIKAYEKSEFEFVAILPNQGVDIYDYVASLTGEKLSSLIASKQNKKVLTSMPKFRCEYQSELNETLEKMGITDVFENQKANLTAMASYKDGNLNVSKIIHKTFIEVAESGTKAGAATLVSVDTGGRPPEEQPKEVYLNRPFIYMITDKTTSLPVFMGVMTGTK